MFIPSTLDSHPHSNSAVTKQCHVFVVVLTLKFEKFIPRTICRLLLTKTVPTMKSSLAFLLLMLGAAAPRSVKASATLRGRRTIEDGRQRGDGFTGQGEAEATEWEDNIKEDSDRMPAPIASNTELILLAPAAAPEQPTPIPTTTYQSDLSVVTPSVPSPTPSPPTNRKPGGASEVHPTQMPTLSFDTDLSVVKPSVPSPPPTPKPTLPKLFADDTSQSGGFDLCSRLGADNICGFNMCNAPVLDAICAYFGSEIITRYKLTPMRMLRQSLLPVQVRNPWSIQREPRPHSHPRDLQPRHRQIRRPKLPAMAQAVHRLLHQRNYSNALSMDGIRIPSPNSKAVHPGASLNTFKKALSLPLARG